MKRIVLLVLAVINAALIFAQVPEGINYQAIVRNAEGELIISSEINFRISILEGSITGNPEFVETQLKQTSLYGVSNLVIGEGTNVRGSLSAIDWGSSTYYLKIEADITGGDSFMPVGTVQLYSVPYALYASESDYTMNAENAVNSVNANHATTADNANNSVYSDTAHIANKLNQDVLYFSDSDTLFAVKDRNGKIVFAVFNDGVKVYVNEGSKGNVGGFAVSGRGTGKSTEYSVLNVTPDSARFYLNEGTKGTPGGFAVSGRGTGKNVINDYLQVTPDSTRIYINETTKGTPGGFAVSGRGTGKSNTTDYFNISVNQQVDTINSEARVLWYPKKEAFMAGRVIVESPDSVGLNSWATGFESKAIGDYSQALGYQSRAYGDYSSAIGYQAMADSTNAFAFGNKARAQGINSFAFGEDAEANSSESYSFGRGAKSYGYRSFAFGSSGVDSSGAATGITQAKGDYSFAIGQGSITGIDLENCPPKPPKLPITQEEYWKIYYSGEGAVAIGVGDSSLASYATTIGYYNTASYGSVALGYKNKSYGSRSAILGGYSNTVNSSSAVIAGGHGHIIDAPYAGILGGIENKVHSDATWGVIGGGYRNEAFGSSSTIVNGTYNVATGALSTVIGSRNNAYSWCETVIGRYNNYNTSGNPDEWVDTDHLFVIGNGTADDARSNAMVVLKDGRIGIGTAGSPNSRLHVNSLTGENGLRVQINGSSKLIVNSNGGTSIGTTSTPPVNGLRVLGDAYFVSNVSAISFTDRTPYPKDLETAYKAVLSMNRLPNGEYDENNKEHQLDHSTLHPFVKSSDGENRDLSATVSAQNEVIKDLVKQIDDLKQNNDNLETRIEKLEDIITKLMDK